MAEYVKKEDVLALAENADVNESFDEEIIFAYDVRELSPAADVVEVVRCKDCKFWGSTLTPEEIEEARTDPNSDLVCDMWMSDGFSPDDYCSSGKKRADNG